MRSTLFNGSGTIYRVLIFLLFCFLCISRAGAQNVLITDTTYTADPSAILDVFSYKKGVLIPRIDSAGIQQIATPATSLLVYQKNAAKGFYYYNGAQWVPIGQKDSIHFYHIDSSANLAKIDSIIKSYAFPYATVFYTDSLHDPSNAWLWNGTDYLKMGRTALKIYKNYTDLRNDTLSRPDMVFVNDFTTSANNKVYKTYGGFFVKTDSTLENGGTFILNKKNKCWKRVWDNLHVYPEWWEVGGYDENGKLYKNDYKSEGIQHDGDRLEAVCKFNTQKKIIELTPGYVYEHTNDGFLLNQYDIINGNNATVKRRSVKSKLTSPATVGTTTLVVANGSEFRIGMKVAAFSGVAHGQQSNNIGSMLHLVTAVNGNSISIAPPVNVLVDTGSVQVLSHQVLTQSTNNDIYNVNFDGNVQEANITHSWVYMNCILTNYKKMRIKGCSFINMPSECITAPSELWVEDCYIENLYGSFLHGSVGNVPLFETAGFYIKNIKGRDICKVKANVNGHASQYGFYSQSLGTKNVVIEGCYIENGNYGGVITPLTASSDQFTLSNNYFFDFGHILSNISLNPASTGVEDLRITNNTFINCGVLNVEASVNSLPIYKNLTISNNTFINCKLSLLATEKATVTGNKIIYKPDSTFIDFMTSKENFGTLNNAFLNISSGSTIVSDNVIQANAYDSSTFVGIKIFLRTANTLSKLTIDNNQLTGLRRCIETVFQGNNVFRDHITISNNLLSTTTYPGQPVADFAAQVGHGMRFINNYIKHYDATVPLKVYGSLSTTDPISCVITGNTIEGTTGTQIRVYYYNNILHNNLMTGSIAYDNTTSMNLNMIGMNYIFSNVSKKVVPTLRSLQIHSGTTVPTVTAPNGSMYTNETTGDTYLRIQGVWKKIMVQ